MLRLRTSLLFFNFLAILPGFASAAPLTTLHNYAAACDAEIGITVPGFNCDDGTIVPTTVNGVTFTPPSGAFTVPATCDRPNVLNGKCDPGSKFQVITNTPEAYVVAHCRRQGNQAGHYTDVAVIQHNKVTGATCFYQNQLSPAPGIVKSPKTQTTEDSQRFSPGTGCMTCHDNGPIIRTPYLAQIKTGKDVMPGTDDFNFNKSHPYFLVTAESTKTYAVNVTDNNSSGTNPNGCVTCHTLSVHSSGTSVVRDSAGHLALKSTEQFQASKTPTSTFAPMWMKPNTTAYSQANFDAANEIVTCAKQFTTPSNSFTAPLTGNSNRKCTVAVKPGRVTPPSSIVLQYGKCLDLKAADYSSNSTNGHVSSYNCYAGNLNQKWTYKTTGEIVVKNGSIERCLNVDSVVFDGMSVNTTTCNGSSRQKWIFDPLTGQLRAKSTDDLAGSNLSQRKCLDVDINTVTEEGAIVQMWSCNNSSQQAWAIQDLKFNLIKFTADTSKAINIEGGALSASSIQPGWWSAAWTIERVRSEIIPGSPARQEVYYRIRNKWHANEFLNIEFGSLQATEIQPNWESALWIVRNRPEKGQNVFTIQNKWQPSKFIVLNSGVLSAGSAQSSLNNARWTFSVAP